MVDLNTPITDETLNEIGQVWARSIETALEVANIPVPMGRRLLNVLYNRAHQDRARTGTAMQFWKEFKAVDGLALEVNLESKGIVGTCTHVWQINSNNVGFVVDGKGYIMPANSSVRHWKRRISREALEDAQKAVDEFTATVEGAEQASVFIQINHAPEALDATQIYREGRNLLSTTKEDNVAAGASSIYSEHTAEWLVQNKAELLGRTVEVRRSLSIHPANMPNIKGILEEAWFEYGSAQFVIGGIKCADGLKDICRLWEPNFCDHIISSERMLRCAKLHNHRGGHSPVRPT